MLNPTRVDHQTAALTIMHYDYQNNLKGDSEGEREQKIKEFTRNLVNEWPKSPNGNLYINCKVVYTPILAVALDAFTKIYDNSESIFSSIIAFEYNHAPIHYQSVSILGLNLNIPEINIKSDIFKKLKDIFKEIFILKNEKSKLFNMPIFISMDYRA